MTASTTMTIRLSAELKKKLDRLTALTQRSRSFLSAEAVKLYVERELEIMEGIERGLADVQADRLLPHDEAMEDVKNVIRKARKKPGAGVLL
jgi:predicted transcriptional regulator